MDKSGFEEKNSPHILVACGDCFDRGKQPCEIVKYLMEIHYKILNRGNHVLFKDLGTREYPAWNDSRNGTLETVKFLGGCAISTVCHQALLSTQAFQKEKVDYFEAENDIFVHS